MKSSETSLSSSTTANGPKVVGGLTPSSSARKAAEACRSCAATMVWLSWTAMARSLPCGEGSEARSTAAREGRPHGDRDRQTGAVTISRIGLVVHNGKEVARDAAERVRAWARDHGLRCTDVDVWGEGTRHTAGEEAEIAG